VNTATAVRGQALEVARRLLDPGAVIAAAGDGDASLGSGLAGTALLHARMSATDPAFADAATRHWAAAATHAKRHAGGIFAGAGGLATSLIIGTPYLPDPGPHQAAVARAAQWLSRQALDLTRRHHEQRRAGDIATPWAVYDVITGLSGIGRILLAAVVSGHATAETGLLAALETLTTMISTPHGNRPGWWLPPGAHPSGVTVHPSGAATTGMAHGISGPLALLSSAHAAGWAVAGQTAAITNAARWLLNWRQNQTWSWPPYVTGDELDQQTARPAPGRRDAWCYGTPGISRALSLAGQALDDTTLAEAGAASLASLADRPVHEWDAGGPTLCHGYAGILQCATVSGAPAASRTATAAADAIAAAFNPARPFAFPHDDDTALQDRPGFLTGAVGVALTLADHAQLLAPPMATPWDAILLLS
jgi:hypothetical protein